MPSFLYRKTENRRHRRPRRQVPRKIRYQELSDSPLSHHPILYRPGAVTVFFVVALVSYSAAGEITSQRSAVVTYVIDGDTIEVDDDTRVRLLGVNSPEIGYNGATDEPMARRARKFVADRVVGKTVTLKLEPEKRDPYGRLLAHVFLKDGTNLQEQILAQGLGSVVAIPPNIGLVDIYQIAERAARRDKLGIWNHRYYRPVTPQQLGADARRHRFVTGTVNRIGRSHQNFYLDLGPRFSVVIPHEDWRQYWGGDINRVLGAKVVARGWVFTQRTGKRVRVRHPAMLELSALAE